MYVIYFNVVIHNIIVLPIVSDEYYKTVDTDEYATFHDIKKYGSLMVEFFLVISGIILAKVYWTSNRSNSLKTLMGRRAARFYPLHWATEIAFIALNTYYVLHYESKWKFTITENAFTKCISLTQMWFNSSVESNWNFQVICNAPTWSLSVEWFVNIIMFLCIRFVPIHFSLLIFEIMAYLGYYNSLDGNTTNPSVTAPLYYAFFFGVVFHKVTTWIHVKYRAVQLLFDIMALFLLISWKEQVLVDFNGSISTEYQIIRLQIVTWTAWLVLWINNSFLMKRFFNNPIFTYLGKISYSVYLCQFCFLLTHEILQNHGYSALSSTGDVVHFVILTLCGSSFVFYFFEKPVHEYIVASVFTDSTEVVKKIKNDLEYQKVEVLHSPDGVEEDMTIKTHMMHND